MCPECHLKAETLMNFGYVAFWQPPHPLPLVAFRVLLADPLPPNWLRGFWMTPKEKKGH